MILTNKWLPVQDFLCKKLYYYHGWYVAFIEHCNSLEIDKRIAYHAIDVSQAYLTRPSTSVEGKVGFRR